MPCQVGAGNDTRSVFTRSKILRLRSEQATRSRGGAGGCELAGGFVLGAEAPRADVDFSLLSLYHNRSSLDIRQPLSRGMLFGMAYTAPKVSFFSANFALHRDFPIR